MLKCTSQNRIGGQMININSNNSGFNNEDLANVKQNTLDAYKTLMTRSGEGSEMLG